MIPSRDHTGVPGDVADMLIEIAEWESAETQKVHIEKAAAADVFAPLLELVAAPFKATVIQKLP